MLPPVEFSREVHKKQVKYSVEERETLVGCKGSAYQLKTYEWKSPQHKLYKKIQISTTAPSMRPYNIATLEILEKKKRGDLFAELYMAGRPRRRGRGARQLNDVKPLIGK